VKRLLLAALLLSACAPAVVRTAPPAFQASFSEGGVLWQEGGKVTLARFPVFRKVPVGLPSPATAVGWQRTAQMVTPWVALGGLGLLVTADGRPATVQAGPVVAMSSTQAYRQDGSAVGYDAQVGVSGLLGAPDAVVTGGDGLDYAVQDGKLYRLENGRQTLLTSAAQPYLYAEPGGAGTANAPTAVTQSGRYTLTGTVLERRDGAGALLASLPHPAGLVGAVGSLIVTVQPGGVLRVFAPDLRELKP
jgi:hypothetical protein